MESLPSSFRDPSGFVFWQDGSVYRQINTIYKDDYDRLMESGLHKSLVEKGLIIPHDEVALGSAVSEFAYKVIRPEQIPFVSYPYEWSFSQLKDAALTTLDIQKNALEFGMSLKDCSAYNIQLVKGRPVFIDTLSFEKYHEGSPWVAYRQFCQHFFAPLALMSCRDVRLGQLLRIHLDGVPIDLASKLLPWRTRFSFSLLSHIHLHAKTQTRYADRQIDTKGLKLSRRGFIGIIDSLESGVKGLKWNPGGTEWGDYYRDTNYSAEALQHKKQVVEEFLKAVNPSSVWDLGANIGIFSRIASGKGIPTVSFDIDPAAVEKNYLECRRRNETCILPILSDLTNPSPGIGWQNQERMSLAERGPADAVLALALTHHLAISNNTPFAKIAEFFASICNSLIVEFVPKSDSQVQRLLATRKDIFVNYTQQAFETEFAGRFVLERSQPITGSERILYLMRRREST
ncbi:MAG: class I SAM-dependent methyltransferase [Dehalococcoidia bacterium]|nr:class I SAM-dependent methyltransferase [Dehalococcoidia bacterium]